MANAWIFSVIISYSSYTNVKGHAAEVIFSPCSKKVRVKTIFKTVKYEENRYIHTVQDFVIGGGVRNLNI